MGEDEVGGVLASKDGTIWVANTHSLDYIVNGNVSSIRADAGLPGHQVTAMLEDRAGNLWVGVDDGLYLFKNGRFLRLPEPNHTPLGLVDGLAEDVDGNIWAECSGDPPKLVRIRDFQVREEFPASQVPPGHALAADPRGGIWIGTSQGEIALLRNGVLETKFPLNPGGDPSNRQIMAQADGSILAGSENGLVGWREGKVQRLTSKNGLPCDSVISFVEDKEKRWWLFTRCGIVELKDSELQRWWANPDAVVQIRVDDALDGVQPGKPYSNPAAYSSDGRVWFATSVVVQMVDPSKLSRKAVPADTYIESVTVDRKEFAANENLRLGPHPRDLQIDYTSPTFLIPQRVRFRYRLDPYDRDWHDVGIRRQAFYTDLPPGQYTFRVMATSCDDVWNDRAATLAFSVSPAYYQTNWFRVLCAMIFVGLLWVGYQFRIRRLQREFDVTLDARVAERTRIARELHDTLLQSFHGLLLQLQTVSHLLPQGKAKEKLDTTIDQAAEAITEGRDTVQGLRDSTTQTNALALALRALKEELLAGSSGEAPEFRVAVEGEPRDLHPIVRDDIYKLATEALRNAFRHAQAKNVEAQIQYGKEQFRLWIRDDGRGLDPAVLAADGRKGHYGIAGMRERAKAMGGKLEIRSTLNAGTELEVTIPAKTAYSRSPGRSWLTFRLSSK